MPPGCSALTGHPRHWLCLPCEQLLHSVARQGAFLPPGDGTPFRIGKLFLEDMVKDVLEVEEVHSVADIDELRGHLFARALRLVARDPELGRSAVSGDGDISKMSRYLPWLATIVTCGCL